MPALTVTDLYKHFNGVKAVDGLSFDVSEGEVFGLLGPNGAGKTTTIRVVMDIFKADSGTVEVLGVTPREARPRVGYLPEERGLYRGMKCLDVLVYLAQLKGLSRADARSSATTWLERVELTEWAGRRVSELSRGMQQKLQFAATVAHGPRLVILDEPFQGLDPVNVELVKTLIRDLRDQGVAVMLSAHEMSLVEEMCDRIVLIDDGRAVLYGPLRDIKRQFAPHAVRVTTPDDITNLTGVSSISRIGDAYLLTLDDSTTYRQVLRELTDRRIDLESFEVATIPLDEIFIAVVTGQRSPDGLAPVADVERAHA